MGTAAGRPYHDYMVIVSASLTVGFRKTTRRLQQIIIHPCYSDKIDFENFYGDGEVNFYFLSGIYGLAMRPANARGGLGHCAAFPRLAEAARVAAWYLPDLVNMNLRRVTFESEI